MFRPKAVRKTQGQEAAIPHVGSPSRAETGPRALKAGGCRGSLLEFCQTFAWGLCESGKVTGTKVPPEAVAFTAEVGTAY